MSKLYAAALFLTACNVVTAYHFGTWLAAFVTNPTLAVSIIFAKAFLPLVLLAWHFAEKESTSP